MRHGELRVSELFFYWLSFIFLMLVRSDLAHFSEIQPACDRRTKGPSDVRRTDRRTHPLIEMRERI